jgi:uncharacterized Ntn-hydrolase superfamily protein
VAGYPRSPICTPSTFSIVASDPATGDLGVAVQSKFLAVGAIVPWATAGAGAVATQAWANTGYGPEALALMAMGEDASSTIQRILEADEGAAHRQVGIVDARGGAATYTGDRCHAWAGGQTGSGFACQGNILAGPAVVDAMARAYEASRGGLGDRLLAALEAGQAAGGDRRGQRSASLLVVRAGGGYGGRNDRFIDLRGDDHPAPIAELNRLLDLHKLYLFPSDPADLTPVTEELARELQSMLLRAGLYLGPVSGAWDDATQTAMRVLVGIENLEERWREDGLIDRVVLEFLRQHYPEA